MSTGKGFSGKTEEYGVSRNDGPGKIGIKAVAAVGVEASAYVNVNDAVKSAVSGVTDFVKTANKEFTIDKIIPKPPELF